MATLNNSFTYPQKYFLEGEALRHFGIKTRTYKNWIESGLTIPGRLKVKGSNYYVIEPEEFHKWLIETRLEPATKFKTKSRKGGKPTRDNVPDGKSFPSGANKSNGLAI